MTTGQRIAHKRRELGLSQEQLGQEMGVSRQSIYKWESDAALPEIDKLIALSRRFGVSVGWLLGEESRETETQEAADSLTEEQMRLIQQLVAAYQPPRSRKRHWAVGAGFAVMAVLLLVALLRLQGLGQDYQRVNQSLSRVESLYSDLSNQIASITDQVETAMEAQADLTSARQVELEGFDLAAGTVTFRLSATPKAYSADTELRFLALSGEDSVEVPAEAEGQVFSARLTCPLSDDIRLMAVFYQGDSRSTQILRSYSGLYTDSLVTVSLGWDPSITQTAEGCSLNRSTWAGIDYSYVVLENVADQVQAESIRVGLFRDRQLVCWMTETDLGGGGIQAAYQLPREVPLTDGASYCAAAVVRDSAGREVVWSSECYIWQAESNAFDLGPDYLPELRDPSQWSY